MKLSIIIPVFNEEKTIGKVIKKVIDTQLPVNREIIIVNDGSSDNTRNEIEKVIKHHGSITLIEHKKNMGKGVAVKTGIVHAGGDYIIIQDADLEYDPHDIKKLLVPILEKKAEVVYGTRLKRLPNFNRDERTFRFLSHYMGNKVLSLITSVIYGQWLTDMETCYKLFPKKALDGYTIHARGFEFEPEITAKLLKKGYKIYETPISTNPRGYAEGKKLNTVTDGCKALWSLAKYRFVN